MRNVSKSLITLSMCLGLSGAVYAQATPSAVKPSAPATETAKSKPAPKHVAKTDPAAVSGVSTTPAVKSPKHEHAARVAPKPAVEKANKLESPDAKKLDSTPAKETKSHVAKPESVKSNVAKPESTKSPVAKPESMKSQPTSASSANQVEHTPAANPHKSVKHEASKSAAQTAPVAAQPVK